MHAGSPVVFVDAFSLRQKHPGFSADILKRLKPLLHHSLSLDEPTHSKTGILKGDCNGD